MPPKPWGELAEAIGSEKGGMISLHVRSPLPAAKCLERYRDVRVSTSTQHVNRFIVRVNSHFGLAKEDAPVPVGEHIERVLGHFERELQVAREISNHIWSLGEGT